MNQLPSEKAATFYEVIKNMCTGMNWKHGLILAAVGLILYPKPIIKLFMPLVSKFSKNHSPVKNSSQVREIILTSNESVNFDTLSKLKIIKGARPQGYKFKEEERKCIQLIHRTRKRSNVYETCKTQNVNSSGIEENNNELFGETIWNSYRLQKLENKKLKCVLIKCSEPILQIFMLRFYDLAHDEIHKIGMIPHNRLHVLRLDERVGTYEHLTTVFEEPSQFS